MSTHVTKHPWHSLVLPQGAREHPFQEGGGIERALYRPESGQKIRKFGQALGPFFGATLKATETLSFLEVWPGRNPGLATRSWEAGFQYVPLPNNVFG